MSKHTSFYLILYIELRNITFWGTWVAQLVKHPTLGFSSGHDLTVCGFEPQVGLCAISADWDSHFLPLSLHPLPALSLSLSLSLKIHKNKLKKKTLWFTISLYW